MTTESSRRDGRYRRRRAAQRERRALVVVLIIALATDVTQPATLGFVMLGMSSEYSISKPTAGLPAPVAHRIRTHAAVFEGRG